MNIHCCCHNMLTGTGAYSHKGVTILSMNQDHPEIAQLFLEAAGAETIHGISLLRVAGGVGKTFDNLDEAANGEDYEIEEMYPRFVHEAEQEGRNDAVAS